MTLGPAAVAGRPSFDMPATSRTRDLAWLLLLSMAAAAAALSARGRHRGPPVEAAPRAIVPAGLPGATRAALPKTPPAREVRDAVRRVFGDVVVADVRRAVTGDFNGDGDLDLAVVARPAAGARERINHELANWTLQDASAPGGAGASRVEVGEQDVLLAVIHGYGAGGWRNPQARQSYIVRNASLARPRVVRDARGLAQAGPPPCLSGQALVDAAPGRPGFLCWSGTRYAWTPPDASATR